MTGAEAHVRKFRHETNRRLSLAFDLLVFYVSRNVFVMSGRHGVAEVIVPVRPARSLRNERRIRLLNCSWWTAPLVKLQRPVRLSANVKRYRHDPISSPTVKISTSKLKIHSRLRSSSLNDFAAKTKRRDCH